MRFNQRSTIISVLVIVQIAFVAPLSMAQQNDRSGIYIDATSANKYTISVVLTDPDGKRTGLISVPPDMNVTEPIPGTVTEIPNSGVAYDAIDNHATGERSPGTLTVSINSPIGGKYNLEVKGTELTYYKIGIFTIDSAGNKSFKTFMGVTDVNVNSIYALSYSSIPEGTTEAFKITTNNSIQQDVDLSFKVDWIKNAGLKNSLLQKLQNAEAAHGRGNTKAAGNLLNAFLNEVKAQTGKGLDPDAAEMFEQDVHYILEHL
jgi:hypothetical protein